MLNIEIQNVNGLNKLHITSVKERGNRKRRYDGHMISDWKLVEPGPRDGKGEL